MRQLLLRRLCYVFAAYSALAGLPGTPLAHAAEPSPQQTAVLEEGALLTPGEFTKDNKKFPAGTVEPINAKFGKGWRLSFVEGASGGFMSARVRPTEAWNHSAGFSFWVKGDGSAHWGGIELIDRDDYGMRYGYCFPIDSTDWKKITVPWRDVVPELASPLMNVDGGFQPNRIGSFFFGKWFYWRDYPAESYEIDHVVLEDKIDLPPDVTAPAGAPLDRLRAKLQQHQPITIVSMGDSLTDKRHWSNREVMWAELLAKSLKQKYGSEITLVNPAIGGTTLSQNNILIPRWVKAAPSPDLVTVFFGGNDWDTGVRGARFHEYLRATVDRIRRETKGSADVLLMTTAPGFERWDTYAELQQAVRDVAKEKQTALVDVAAEFRKAGTAEQAMKQEYWGWDKVHLGKDGHTVVQEAVLKAIAGGK